MNKRLKQLSQTHLYQKVRDLFSLQQLPLTIIAAGIIFRIVQYLSNRSLWADEVALALNLVNRSFLELLQPLGDQQGAPIGFLMVEKLAIQLLGDNEYAMRLFPLLAGIVSLFLFYELAKRFLLPQAIPIALALFASLPPLVYYSSEVKQYSSDVAFALASCLLVMQINSQKLTGIQIGLFGFAGAVAIWFSHPAIFVLAGVAISYLVFNWREKTFDKLKSIFIVYSIWVVNFLLIYFISLNNLSSKKGLLTSWKQQGGFPSSVLDLDWLYKSFFNFFQVPLGFEPTWVGVAIIIFITGCLSFLQTRKKLLTILLSPIWVTLFAAYLYKYPFSKRLVLFLTPFVILLIAEGAEYVWKKTRLINASAVGTLILLALLVQPLSSSSYLFVKPNFREEIKPVIRYVKEHQQPGDILYIYQEGGYPFIYYAKKFGYQEGDYILGINELNDGVGISVQEWQRYKNDFDRLKGNKRVWVLFSHISNKETDKEMIQLYLDSMGKRIDSFKATGSFVYLYDFS